MISLTTEKLKNVLVDDAWNEGDEKELLMHTIHAYPAKFPAFIATKAFKYAESEGVNIGTVADVFCGCGTVALESKVHNKNFWGCDINPVATLIAKTKSAAYNPVCLQEYHKGIIDVFNSIEKRRYSYLEANERLRYWYTEKSYLDLFALKMSIEKIVPSGIYKDAFMCMFSAILKVCSRWLTKSIKPQIDPDKKEVSVIDTFQSRYEKFLSAVAEMENYYSNTANIQIENCNFLESYDHPHADLLISSPPYVTSYEYADLHQLSTLWLGYADDYRVFRNGSIGSAYNNSNCEIEIDSLNDIGKKIVNELKGEKKANAKVRAVARYYSDIQDAVHNCSCMINDGGMAFFVVGDTEYKGVQILNSEHLIESMENEGFSDIRATKRIISKKMLTPYRDASGKFSSDKSNRTIYHEEFIITGRMWRN